MPQYRALTGLNYTPAGTSEEVRVEADALVDDLPASAVEWLLACGAIEDPSAPRPVPADVPDPTPADQGEDVVAADSVPVDVPVDVPAPDPTPEA